MVDECGLHSMRQNLDVPVEPPAQRRGQDRPGFYALSRPDRSHFRQVGAACQLVFLRRIEQLKIRQLRIRSCSI